MRRKRLKMEKRYLRLQEGVHELKAFIKFKQDNRGEGININRQSRGGGDKPFI